jgi:hypothetical protein
MTLIRVSITRGVTSEYKETYTQPWVRKKPEKGLSLIRKSYLHKTGKPIAFLPRTYELGERLPAKKLVFQLSKEGRPLSKMKLFRCFQICHGAIEKISMK